MLVKKTYIFLLLFGVLSSIWVAHSGCAKEYSYEGGDTTAVNDTLGQGNPAGPPDTSHPWICLACIGQDEQVEKKWSFHAENFFSCGIIDTAIVNPERTAFTFFGPYSCSQDTGIIIDAFFDGITLTRDLHDISSSQGAFYYYDNIGPSYPLISHVANFSIKIDSYIQQTHLATGTFSGTVYKPDGTSSVITSGKFEIKLN